MGLFGADQEKKKKGGKWMDTSGRKAALDSSNNITEIEPVRRMLWVDCWGKIKDSTGGEGN